MVCPLVRVTTLVENTVHRRGLLGEHGLAFWIDTERRNVLFDTGQGLALQHNAQHLGLHMDSVEAVVLSHGHNDHTGGLSTVIQLAPQAIVYAHPAAFERKYVRRDDGTTRDIGVPDPQSLDALRRAAAWIHAVKPLDVGGGMFVTGPIPRPTRFEDTGGHFFLDGDCRTPDPLSDDQALFFASSQGTVVLLGCAHAGVINTLQYVRKLTRGSPIHAVMGGMHLKDVPLERIERTLEAFRQLEIERLGPAHCTGAGA
ncbi:MAG: MBL fold metallo-hydrolase, partial [Deltaproteobacteria bacterium]|nr:MBL fold metallo-hydrolase [Deltaproteobacteria bacterium]